MTSSPPNEAALWVWRALILGGLFSKEVIMPVNFRAWILEHLRGLVWRCRRLRVAELKKKRRINLWSKELFLAQKQTVFYSYFLAREM